MNGTGTPPPADTLVCVRRPSEGSNCSALPLPTTSEGSPAVVLDDGASLCVEPQQAVPAATQDAATHKKKKKKNKKGSYKDLMCGMLQTSKTEEQAREDRQRQLQQHLGGGAFSKLERI